FREFNIAKHALHNGAHGYILKDSKAEEVYAGIKTVNNGEQFICEKINSIFKNEMTTHFTWLTNTEIKILSLVAEGYTQRQVARIICRDVETVKSHLKNIRIKIVVKTTAQAVKVAYERGILRRS
ncbi:MAG: LuxR C-terminal-related transcriptional regulator, partial [Prevotellaceae bacterium]|nr:LuxR C-terminal-related transcriptional regulator [Prevotellaceae bacterium]